MPPFLKLVAALTCFDLRLTRPLSTLKPSVDKGWPAGRTSSWPARLLAPLARAPRPVPRCPGPVAPQNRAFGQRLGALRALAHEALLESHLGDGLSCSLKGARLPL